MRYLANENFPGAAVARMLDAGCDIVWVRTAAPGMRGREVLDWARREGRVLLTFDKDFGELARTSPPPANCGVVLFRVPLTSPQDVGQRLADMQAARTDGAGHFSVIEPGRVRMRTIRSETG